MRRPSPSRRRGGPLVRPAPRIGVLAPTLRSAGKHVYPGSLPVPSAATARLRRQLERGLPSRPFSIDLWDGTRVASTDGDGPTVSVRSPRAIAHLLRAPGQLGLGRAYVAGLIETDDLDAMVDLIARWRPALGGAGRARLMLAGLRACGLAGPARPSAAEFRPRGRLHSLERDARAVRHHYDVSNEFFARFLDRSMTYSCAIFSRGAATLEEAQAAKHELVCQKLLLKPGQRVLDVGCGWGAFARHAAGRHGVEVVAITLSPAQAALARERAAAAGLADRIDVRMIDYRELRGERFDAIASVGMVEHVGAAQIDRYAAHLAGLLRPGGRLLNHGIARLRHADPDVSAFTHRFVFPDGWPLHLSRVQLALERAGFVTEHVEGFAADYAETLRHWTLRLDEHRDDAVRLVGPERVRVWRLFLRGARTGFETGLTGVYQLRCRAA